MEKITTGGNLVFLVKRPIAGSAPSDTQNLLKGIESKEGGLLVINNEIVLCPIGCGTCNNPSNCITCLEGFSLNANQFCVRCNRLCKTCTTSTPRTCTNCIDGYFISGSRCERCIESCVTCSGAAATCSTCKVGSFLSTGSCIACIDNCNACSFTASSTSPSCDECRRGYVYNPT